MNGLEMLRQVRRKYPQLRVVMFSTLNERGAAITLEALILGATTTWPRPRTKGRSTAPSPIFGKRYPEDQPVLPYARAQHGGSQALISTRGAASAGSLTACFLWVRLCLRSCALRAELKTDPMERRTIITEILPENYRFLQKHVHSQVGIVLEDNKHYLFESRLAPIVKQHGLGSINDLCALLRAKRDVDLDHQVVEAMTTNETYFYRDPAQYEAIRTVLLPKLKQERRDRRNLRFWSAASSSGQEAYTLAMLLLENGFKDWNIQILGTDFSEKVVERARCGIYQQIEVDRGLPAALLVKYFNRSGLDWQLSEPVRKMVRFDTIDLRKSMRTLGPFDLVFCRNVMIYFDNDTKRNVVKEIHSTLFRGGWLLLGGAETTFSIEERFDRETVGNVTVYVAR